MMILGLSIYAWITVIVVLTMFGIMIFTKLPAEFVFLGGIAVLFVTGVLDTKEALSGFSSTSVVLIGVLFVVVAGMERTGVLQWMMNHLLGTPSSWSKAVVRLMLPVAVLSSVLSNTTVVALFVNVVKMWGKKLNIAPSRLLIPLSYASGMGGVCTLIGTPPNLIISGMYAESTGQQMNFFTTTVPETMGVMGGDRLVYCGRISELLKLRDTHGLVSAKNSVFEFGVKDEKRQLHMASVRFGSPLIGKTWDEAGVDGRDELTLVAVSRYGERLTETPQRAVLQAGDTLLLESAPKAKTVGTGMEKALEFMDSDQMPVKTGWPTLVSSAIMVGMILLSSLNVMPLLQSAFLAAICMVVCRCCSPQQAMKSINWNILMVFAGSVVLGTAIQKTGLAEMLANGIVGICGPHPLLVMCAVCVVGTFITEFISNAAAGAMFCPIVYQAAVSMDCNPFPFMVALMIAVSSSFATPIGSPTHMLVYGPGGYRFTDFMRIGFWMNLIILAANLFIVNVLWSI